MGREEHCKQISLVCVGIAHSVWVTLGLPPLTACVLFLSTLLRLQVALKGNFPKQALGCMHFPGLSHSVQVLRYSTKAQIRLGLRFVPFPGLSSSGEQVLDKHTLPRWVVHIITSLVPATQFLGCNTRVSSQVCCVSPLGS